MNFQEMILALQQFWAAPGRDCVIWNPYNVQVGAGTNNPATLLRVLGPEPWRVAYVEPSIRPDDGRYGENPNRMQRFLQYQVILKPEPGNPQELYLQSLAELRIGARDNDIRFVEDNWQSPPLGAWGLGWEVWLNGQEIAQFTYFQQAAGLPCDPVSVEITYGLERMAMAIQGVDSVWDLRWQGELTYGDVYRDEERAHSQYYFEIADVKGLRAVYETYRREHERSLAAGAVLPAYDYVLKCNHIFNVLDARGAVGVTERAQFFRTMHGMTRACANAYLAEREALGFPLREKLAGQWPAVVEPEPPPDIVVETGEHADFLLEIGVEELPPAAIDIALRELKAFAAGETDENFSVKDPQLFATPRRLAILVKNLPVMTVAWSRERRGPPAKQAFDEEDRPTRAAIGFARSVGIGVDELRVEERDGGKYVVATETHPPLPIIDEFAKVLPKAITAFIAKMSASFPQMMRWNEAGTEFSRPIRWLVALFGKQVIPFSAVGLTAGREMHASRQYGSKIIELNSASDYEVTLREFGIVPDPAERRAAIQQQLAVMAEEVGAQPPDDEELLAEVTHLTEAPTVFCGDFDKRFLTLPDVVLTTVMKKHQRYLALWDKQGVLLPHFLAVRDGNQENLEGVRRGNEQVLAARFADAQFFYEQDRKQPLEAYLPRLETLTFHEKLGSMLDKSERLEQLVTPLADLLGFKPSDTEIAQQAARLCKADLATQMVVELTSLQGEMGRIYAHEDGLPEEVAQAIYEHWLPRHAGDELPQSKSGILLALADRLDSLVSLIGVGEQATSSADPFGLRRAALGVIRILIENELDVCFTELCRIAKMVLPFEIESERQLNEHRKESTRQFLGQRLRYWFMDTSPYIDRTEDEFDGIQYSTASDTSFDSAVIYAVMAVHGDCPWYAATMRKQFFPWTEKENWGNLLDGYARCARITKDINSEIPINASFLTEPAEIVLHQEYQGARKKVDQKKDVDTLLNEIENMLPAITRFFDEVLVMAEDEEIRRNRLALLKGISSLADGIVDLSRMPGF